MGRKIAVRTRFFDDFLLDACGSSSSSAPHKHSGLLRRSLGRLGFGWLSRRPRRHRRSAVAPIKQVLILGCGMDTRAWRLPLHDATVVEVDVAPVLRAKDAVLKEVQRLRTRNSEAEIPLTVKTRRAVAADLADPEDDWPARVACVLDVTQPVAVVMEGLLMYLKEEEVEGLLARVARLAAAPGSKVGISLVDWRYVRHACCTRVFWTV